MVEIACGTDVRAISRDRPARNGFGLRVDRVVPQRRGRRRPWPPCSHERGHDCRESTSKGTPLLLDGVNDIAWISKNAARLGFYADVFDAEVGPTRPHGENPGETMTVLRIGPTPGESHRGEHCAAEMAEPGQTGHPDDQCQS